MQKKPFMIIVLVILLAQPFVVVSSMPFAFSNNVTSPEKEIVVSQGTRLEGGDLTDHVPILIDEEADFTTQGWPGTGTVGDPYVISGLNITYDQPFDLIRIFNVDSYFVIRDCYLGIPTGIPDWAIHLENVTDALIEYITIRSEAYGILLQNANDTIVTHSLLDVSEGEAVQAIDSFRADINYNEMIRSGIRLDDSTNTTIFENNIHDMEGSTSGCIVNNSNRTMIISNMINNTNSGDGIALDSSWYCEIRSNTIMDTAGDGMFIGLSEYTLIEDNIVLYAGDQGIQFNTNEWISINRNTINYTNSYPIYTVTWGVSNGEMIENMIAHTSGALSACIALAGGNHENFTITDNYFESQHGGLFTQGGGRWIEFNRNYGTDMNQYLVALQSFPDSEIINNTLHHSNQWGVYTDASHRTNIIGNLINGTGGDPAMKVNGVNMTILNNSVYDGNIGCDLEAASTNAVVQYNEFTDFATAIRVYSVDTTIDSNVISDSGNGIDAQGTSNRAEITNNVIDGANGAAIQLRAINQTAIGNTITNSDSAIYANTADSFEMRDNIIDVADQGLYFYQSTDGIIEDNNMTDCGVYFSTGSSIAQLNHTFSGNYVNDLPLFFGFEDHSETLSGDSYGQIILVNCSDAVINGGLFSMSSVAMQLFYSDRADIIGIGVMDQNTGITIEFSDNVTISDSSFSGDIGDEALWIDNTIGFTAENITMSDLSEGLKLSESSNFSIIDSDFSSIDDYAIRISYGLYGLIQGNTLFNMSYGIDGNHFEDSIIDNNDISFTERAINTWADSEENNVTFNYLHQNGYGIMMDNSPTWFIYNNTFLWNGYGIYMTTAVGDTTVYNNTFGISTTSNGYCDSSDFWDDHVDGGNYWDDYTGLGAYPIPGGSAQDRYPLQYIETKPIINTPLDFSFAEGSEDNFITWVPFDDNLRHWTENITVNIDGLAYGVHTVFVLVEDLDGNLVNDTVMVEVYDETPPEIDGPADTWLFEDTADQTIAWDVSDLNPDNYTVYLDGAVYETGTWTTGELVIDFEGVTEGLYEVEILIHDVDGNPASDILMFLMINDDTAPAIDNPDDVEYTEGTTGNIIEWTPTDEFPDRYDISFNGTPFWDDDWGGSRVAIIVDGLPAGSFLFTITVYDTSGNFVSDTVNVTVIPLIQEPPVPLIDYVLLVIIGAAVGAVVVVVAIVYYLKKKKGVAE
ncbi:MAG: right-handed parallel beta-helix repeat-containing protein [Candidatus Thorarchaeota archaeon]